MKLFFAAATLLLLGSCAGFDVYSDASMTQKTGIPFYSQKPHLLVSRTGAKDKPIDIKVIYITDHSDEYYIKTKSGFGSNKLTLGLTNGMLTSLGQETDPKLAELVTSLTSVPTAFAGADKLGAEAIKAIAEANALEEQSSTVVEFINDLNTITQDFDQLLVHPGFGGAFDSTSANKISVEVAKLKVELQKVRVTPRSFESKRKDIVSALEGVDKTLKKITKSDSLPATGDAALAWSKFEQLQSSLSNLIADIKPTIAAKPELTLYRIDVTSGGTVLTEVSIPG